MYKSVEQTLVCTLWSSTWGWPELPDVLSAKQALRAFDLPYNLTAQIVASSPD